MKLVYRSITYEIQKQFPYQLQISRIVFAFESTFQTWLCECECVLGFPTGKVRFTNNPNHFGEGFLNLALS